MGRKAEPGILYYSVYCNHIYKREVRLLFNDYGSDGYWVWQCIQSYAHKVTGYYFDMNDDDGLLLFATEVCRKDYQLVRDIIDSCVKRGLFDDGLYFNHRILTNVDMQDVYLTATYDRRKKGSTAIYTKEYLLINIPEGMRGVAIVPLGAEVPAPVKPPKKIAAPQPPAEKVKVAPPVAATAEKDLKAEYEQVEKKGRKVMDFISAHRPQFIEPYIDMWNIWALSKGKPQIKMVTDKRKKHFLARIKEEGFDIIEILATASKSTFLLESSFFTFDWFTKSMDNYIKVLEGAYSNETAKRQIDPAPVEQNESSKILKEILAGTNK